MQTQSFSVDIAGKTITADFTDLTGQANGSVIMRMGDTAVLVTAVMSSREVSLPYFPLSVEFEEKFYAAGAILGSRFQRREGRPSDEAVLSARIIDRTIRPLFAHHIRNEIQVVATVLAMGEDDPDVLAVIGASLALSVSDIPWNGPIGAVRIGLEKDGGEILINPTYKQRELEKLVFEVFACGKDQTINMIETAAHEVAEDDIVAILEASTTIHGTLETWQKEIIETIGKTKIEKLVDAVPAAVTELYDRDFAKKMHETVFSARPGKAHLYELKKAFESAVAEIDLETGTYSINNFFEEKLNDCLHTGAIEEEKRADGRKLDEVRALYAQAGGVSDALHGSGIFYRGETHIFTALTLGGPEAAQSIDTIETQDTKKRYMHHYNFPPFSVGETGRVGGFNRRMIGHGALAEKALIPVLPDSGTFPYTIRLVSETMSSNGSSSMGSVCGSTLALMDGGVPITRPVAGIASGLMMRDDKYVLLTDIQGPEDEHGDMDFKVAGTAEGITAIQMDVKVSGIPVSILAEALEKAREARIHILANMQGSIATPRTSISNRAPEILSLHIEPKQIGLVIGGGGKTINAIKETSGVDEITIEDDGTVFITGTGGSAKKAFDHITGLTKIYEIGERYDVTVTSITNFGAFAKLDEHTEGLIHISEIAPFKIDEVGSALAVGDVVPVVVSKVDNGKIGLSIKQRNEDWAAHKGLTASE